MWGGDLVPAVFTPYPHPGPPARRSHGERELPSPRPVGEPPPKGGKGTDYGCRTILPLFPEAMSSKPVAYSSRGKVWVMAGGMSSVPAAGHCLALYQVVYMRRA